MHAEGADLGVKTFRFLKQLKILDDRLVVVRGSKFTDKMYRLAKEDQAPFVLYSKELSGLYNSSFCTILEQEDLVPFPTEMVGVKNDDVYLVRAQLTIPGSFILTTDGALKDTLAPHPRVLVELVSSFLDPYLAKT